MLPLVLLLAAAPAIVQADELRPFNPLSDGRLGELAQQALEYNRLTLDSGSYNVWSNERFRPTDTQNIALVLDDVKNKLDATKCDFEIVPQHSEWQAIGALSLNVKSPGDDGVNTCEIENARITIAPYSWHGGSVLSIHHQNQTGMVQLPSDIDNSISLNFLMTYYGQSLQQRLDNFQQTVDASGADALSEFSAEVAKKFFDAALKNETASAMYYDYLFDIVQEKQSGDPS